jgi:ABC-2 type transport system permease protein
MDQVLTILQREYWESVRRRTFLVTTILAPLFLLGVMVLPILLTSATPQRTIRITVVDPTGEILPELRRAFSDTLKDGRPRFRLEAYTAGTPDTLTPRLAEMLEEDATDLCLLISPDVLRTGRAQLYSQKMGDWDLIQRLESRLSDVVVRRRLEGAGLEPERIQALTRPVSLRSFKVAGGRAEEHGFLKDFLGTWLFVMILYTTILIYGQAVVRSIIQEKSQRIVEILLSSTTPTRMMWGKILGVGSVGLTQYAIWALFGILAAGPLALRGGEWAALASVPASTVFFFVLFFILGYFLYSSIGAAVGAMVNTEQEAQQLQWPMVLMLVIPMLISFSITKDPSSTLARVTSLFPFFTPILMFARINIYPPPPLEIALSIVLTLLTIALTVFVAGRIFRVGILMYGKRPTLPEILRWIRTP